MEPWHWIILLVLIANVCGHLVRMLNAIDEIQKFKEEKESEKK